MERYLVCLNLILVGWARTIPAVNPDGMEQPPRPDENLALAHFERSLAAVMRLLTDRDTLGDIATRSGHDLPPASWSLLEHLDGYGPLRVSDIAACHGVDISSITPRLKSLERADLVARHTLPADARVSLIVITSAGQTALEAVHAARRDIIAQALDAAETPRIDDAAHVLRLIADHMSTSAQRFTIGARPGAIRSQALAQKS